MNVKRKTNFTAVTLGSIPTTWSIARWTRRHEMGQRVANIYNLLSLFKLSTHSVNQQDNKMVSIK